VSRVFQLLRHPPVPLLHTCGCVLSRTLPLAPFACCPVHGFGQEAVGLVMLRDSLRERLRTVPQKPTEPRRR
jgi:hypothetical protein